MKIIEGKYTDAIVYSDTAEESALSQVKVLCDQPWVKDSKIRMMPDIHAGKGCTIGTTMTFTDKICPINLQEILKLKNLSAILGLYVLPEIYLISRIR